MYVKDHMTKNPVTITADVSLSKALDLMGKHKFHRLPVVDDHGKLIGLVTEGLVDEKSGRESTSLSIYELNYLLARTKASDIMIEDVKTIDPDAFVEEAAERMLDNGINVLPVVDSDDKVIGIITEKDIFQTFVDLLGLKHQGTKFVIRMEDKPGAMVKAMQLLAQNDANVEAAGVYHTEERGTEVFIKATGEIAVEAMTKILKDAGLDVVKIIQTTKDGKKVHFDPAKI